MAISFREFVQKKTPSNDPAGDFIKDARADSSLPAAKSWSELRGYLEQHGAIPEAITAAKIVWEEFERTRRKPNRA